MVNTKDCGSMQTTLKMLNEKSKIWYYVCIFRFSKLSIAYSMLVTQLDADNGAKTKINLLPDFMELLV